MKVAALQYDIAWEDREGNYATVAGFAAEAKTAGADVLVLPEMFSTGFSMNPNVTAELQDGPTMTFLRHLSQEQHLNIIAGIAFKTKQDKVENVAVAIDSSGNEVSRYSKMQLFTHAGEHHYHMPGASPVTFSLCGVNCACFICYDLRFPSLFRLVNDRCDVYFIIASWPSRRQRHWDILLPARAVENLLYVVGVNRIGYGGGLAYTGGSRIIGPSGEDIANAEDRQTLIFGTIEKDHVRHLREEMPFLQDRRRPTLGPTPR